MSGEVDPRVNIGILGGGQLGRMLSLSAYPLGIATTVLDPTVRVSASKVCHQLQADYDDPAALKELVNRSDVVTYEFENIPEESLENVADEIAVYPPKQALEVSDDRLTEKRYFGNLGIETTEIRPIASESDLREAAKRLGLPLIVKTRRMGYDGKGQAHVERQVQISDAWDVLDGRESIAEAKVDFRRELSVLGVRGIDGSIRIYPIVENIHREGILVESRAPAPGLDGDLRKKARRYCRDILEDLDYVGILAVELFETDDGLLASEMAPRVHNSGHWTIEGTQTSQFENHIRAVAGLPLGSAEAVGHTRMLNIIGEHPDRNELLSYPDVHLHDYEKAPRPGRKIGHVTIQSDDPDRADQLIDEIRPLVTSSRDLG